MQDVCVKNGEMRDKTLNKKKVYTDIRKNSNIKTSRKEKVQSKILRKVRERVRNKSKTQKRSEAIQIH